MACSESFTNDEIKNRIKNIWTKFVSAVEPERLSDWLVQGNVINIDQWQRIHNNYPTKESQCRGLLYHLFSVPHPRAFLVVRQALVAENHYLLESIDNQEPGSGFSPQPDIQIALQGYSQIHDTEKAEKQGMNCEDKNRGCEEEKDRFLKMQSEHKDRKRAWDEDKDRLLKIISEHEDQKRAWGEDKDRLLTIISEHEHLKRAWVGEKVHLLKVQKDLATKLQLASSMRETVGLLQRVILFIVWLFSLLDKRLSDVPNAIEEVNSGRIALKVFDSPQDQENIARLTLEQVNRIIGMADIHPVQIEVELSLKRIRVQGPLSQVTLVVSQIHQIFQEPHNKEITEKDDEGNVAQWEYEDGKDFVRFRDEINAIIEKAYREKKPCAEWEDENAKHRLTFSTMVEECITQLGTPPVKVRRTCIAKDFPRDALPSTLALTDPVQKKIN